MTTSTPPAWKWRDECDVPAETQELPVAATLSKQNGGEALSAGSCILSDSATLGIRNDSPDPTYQDCWPSKRYPSDQCANGEQNPPSALIPSDQCDECRAAPGRPHATGCEVSCSPVISCGRKHDNLHHEPSLVTVESCPECGTVTDIEYGTVKDKPPDECSEYRHRYLKPEDYREMGEESLDAAEALIGMADAAENGTVSLDEVKARASQFEVPFPVQSWLFEALIETEIDHLHEIIDDHHDEIVKMARERHREGHVLHGSKGYQWDAKTRLRNVLEELSDAPTYLTMGPVE